MRILNLIKERLRYIFKEYSRITNLEKSSRKHTIKFRICSSTSEYAANGKIEIGTLDSSVSLYSLSPEEIWSNQEILEGLRPSDAMYLMELYFKEIISNNAQLQISRQYFDTEKNTKVFEIINIHNDSLQRITLNDLISNPSLLQRLKNEDVLSVSFESGYAHAEKTDKLKYHNQ
jgi:hypothetical protein